VAIFVDGCFWHGCPDHLQLSSANRDWWEEKIATNQERDSETSRLLEEQGWQVVRVWEHEDPEPRADQIVKTFFR